MSSPAINGENGEETDKSNAKKRNFSLSSPLIVQAKWLHDDQFKILKLNPFDTVINSMQSSGFSIESFTSRFSQSFTDSSNEIANNSQNNETPPKNKNSQNISSADFPEDETKILYICNGKILLEDVSFDYQGVKSGMTIIAYAKTIKKNTNKKKLRFLELMKSTSDENTFKRKNSNSNANLMQTLYRIDSLEQSRRNEISRLNDMAFSAWETMPDFPNLLKEMLRKEEMDEENKSKLVKRRLLPSPLAHPTHEHFLQKSIETDIQPARRINDQPLPNPFVRRNCLKNSASFKSNEESLFDVSHTEMKNHLNKKYKKTE